MQYVERAIGSVTKSWSSINPATLSGAIDVIVVEHLDGELACSPFHVRFGKFQILKPSQKKVEVIVNGQSTNIPMKLGESGEAYFVFETDSDLNNIPDELIASPIVSAASSPNLTPKRNSVEDCNKNLLEPDFLDINDGSLGEVSDSFEAETELAPGQTDPNMRKNFDLKYNIPFEERMNSKLNQKKIPNKIDNNGDFVLDIQGYKSSKNKVHDTDEMLKQLLQEELGKDDISPFVKEDYNGNIRIVNPYESVNTSVSLPGSPTTLSTDSLDIIRTNNNGSDHNSDFTESTLSRGTVFTNNEPRTSGNYIKTIRLISDQLKCLDLKPGVNGLAFSIDKGKAIVTAKLFLWKWDVPIVISDIDGTITKSDALGHVMTMIGKDWTHPGVAKLFTEIQRNGYNIMYLTARSAGQADSTRSYLRSIQQGSCTLPEGPVILSPDRTMAALRREVILKKPEVFKIACLNDIQELYFRELQGLDNVKNTSNDEYPTPFYAGFGNRITDALSYRTVGIPSSRIFTINPDGEVHMELLELTGLRSSYVHINELVDQFFPHVKRKIPFPIYDDFRSLLPVPGSPPFNHEDRSFYRQHDEKFSDVNFWREPVLSLDEISDISDHTNNNYKHNLTDNATPPVTSLPPPLFLPDSLDITDVDNSTTLMTSASSEKYLQSIRQQPAFSELLSDLSSLQLFHPQLTSAHNLSNDFLHLSENLDPEQQSCEDYESNDFTDDEFDEDEFEDDLLC